METNENTFTWRDLKKFLNELPEEELDKKVVWLGEDRGGEICSAERLEEDYGTDDYCLCPVSILEENNDDKEDIEVVYQKGTPMLYEYIDIAYKNKVMDGIKKPN